MLVVPSGLFRMNVFPSSPSQARVGDKPAPRTPTTSPAKRVALIVDLLGYSNERDDKGYAAGGPEP